MRGNPRVAFVHRRLSILDLSESARQPMVRCSGNVFLTYNGEVYNFRELRSELERDGVRFRTRCDTEVVLESYLHWGMKGIDRLRGMFAFAIADLRVGKVFLARDHLGVKPLYYGRARGRWVFSSELKSFAALGDFGSVDPAAIRKYLRFLWIPGQHTGLRDVQKVEPGTWVEIDLGSGEHRQHEYWSPLRVVNSNATTSEERVEHLRAELARVVSEQLVSDVPLGAFLSGGLDSSLVVSLMAAHGAGPPATYSVGYSARDLAYDIVPDDLPYARSISRKFGTRSHEIVLSPDVASLLPKVVEALDEPLGDPAAISSFLICEAARATSTVMLSGMGADEIFGGYPRQRALLYGGIYRALPPWVRATVGRSIESLPGSGRGAFARAGRAGKKFVSAVERDPLSHYIAMETYFGDDRQRALLAMDGPIASTSDPMLAELATLRAKIEAVSDSPLRQAMLWDLVTYLPCLNLAYTDRTSMAHGVEVRVPFLDVRLVEWSLGLPASDLIRWRGGRLDAKWLLKRAAEPLLPEEVIWRRKAGFGAPVRSWLRNDLEELREELLGTRGLAARGWFDDKTIRELQAQFLAGRADHALQIWMLLSLELWARRFIDAPGATQPRAAEVSTTAVAEKPQILCMMQLPPPVHGASVINQHVVDSDWLASRFALRVLPLRFADSLEDIAHVSARKVARSLVVAGKLLRMLREQRPDAVCLTLAPSGGAFYRDCVYVAIMKAFRVPRIYHMHGKGVAANSRTRVKRALYKWVFRDAWVIHLSPALASDVGHVAAPDRLLFVANGVPDHSIAVDRTARTGPPRILYLSNMVEAKGPLLLLDALGKLADSGRDFSGTFAGAASSRACVDTFERRLAELGLEDRVRYIGPVYGAAKDELFRAHDIFAFPTYNDAFPLVVLEAMQHALPVISTFEGSIPEIVDHDETGVLVPRRDVDRLVESLQLLCDDRARRLRMGERARKRYEERYTLRHFEENFAHALECCLQARLA